MQSPRQKFQLHELRLLFARTPPRMQRPRPKGVSSVGGLQRLAVPRAGAPNLPEL